MAGKSNEKPAPTATPGPSGTSSSGGAKKKGAVGFVDKVEKNGHPSSSSESSASGGAGHGSRSSTSSWSVSLSPIELDSLSLLFQISVHPPFLSTF